MNHFRGGSVINKHHKPQKMNRLSTGILFGFLIFYFLLNVGSIRFKTFTTDEEKHYRYGMNILNGESDRFDDSKMPFSALNAIPAKLAPFIPEGTLNLYLQKEQTGRLLTILFSVGVAYLVFHWSRSLYGVLPGFLALLLYIFDPNIIAHSRLMTTDIYATGMVAFTLYTFWLFLKHRTWKYATLSAVVLGVSQLAKYTSAYLYPILILILLVVDAPTWRNIIRDRDYRQVRRKILIGLGYASFFLLISILMINIGFLFNNTFTPLEDYVFRSNLFQTIQEKFSQLGFLPIPTPYPFLDGLDWVQSRERTGIGYGRLYMLGELRRGENFKGYYVVASLFKMPIGTQLIVFAAIAVYLLKFRQHDSFANEVVLFVPLLFFFWYFNFVFRAQIGIRFYLVIYPLLYVFCGSLVRNWRQFSLSTKLGIGILSLYMVGSVLAAYPHYIPYFNELVWDKKDAYKYLVDSNLDWQQAEFLRDQYLKENPDVNEEPPKPLPGRLLVSPNNLVGIVEHPSRYNWLRDIFQPEELVAGVYLVYDIKPEDFRRILYQYEY